MRTVSIRAACLVCGVSVILVILCELSNYVNFVSFRRMYLYNLTLQRATAITHAIHGNFSGTKQQEIVVSRGKILEVLRPDPNTGKVYTLLTEEVFGVVRSLMPFRLTGGTKGLMILFFNLTVLCTKIQAWNMDLVVCENTVAINTEKDRKGPGRFGKNRRGQKRPR